MSNAFKKVRIIVVFGDISGFTEFCESVTNDAVEYDPFMAEFFGLISETKKKTGYCFSNTGDGFMCTVDLPQIGPGPIVVQVLMDLWKLLGKIQCLIENKDAPRPSGFRISSAAGYVNHHIDDREIVKTGKPINHAHDLLDIARGKGFVCDDSVRQLVSDRLAKKHAIQFMPINDHTWLLRIGRRGR